MDYILNGQGYGEVATALINGVQLNADDPLTRAMDLHARRPWVGHDGRSYVNRSIIGNDGKRTMKAMVVNNPISQGYLRKNDWLQLDETLLRVALKRLKFVADLRKADLIYTMPDGMAKPILQFERMGSTQPATLSMDGTRESRSDRPLFDLNNVPLPIAHFDFNFPLRQLMASRTGDSPLDFTMAEEAGERVAELIEQLAIGTYPSYSFGGGTVYGITNFPQRLTGSLTQVPFISSAVNTNWNPFVTINDVLAMRQQSQNANHFGPWKLYCGLNWDQYMDNDYVQVAGVGSSNATVGVVTTLRKRLKDIGFESVSTLDYLPRGTTANPAFDLVLVQQKSTTMRLIMGMDLVTIQWELQGGMQQFFKTMCIIVPHPRADMNNNCGIVHWN